MRLFEWFSNTVFLKVGSVGKKNVVTLVTPPQILRPKAQLVSKIFHHQPPQNKLKSCMIHHKYSKLYCHKIVLSNISKSTEREKLKEH